MFSLLLGSNPVVELLDYTIGWRLTSLRGCRTVSKIDVTVCILTRDAWVLTSPHLLQDLMPSGWWFAFDHSRLGECEVVSPCGSALRFSDDWRCLAPFHAPAGYLCVFFGDMSVQILCSFYSVICLLVLELLGFMCSRYRSLIWYVICKYFCPILRITFLLFWWCPLNCKGFNFDEVQLVYFSFVAPGFDALSKKPLPDQGPLCHPEWRPHFQGRRGCCTSIRGSHKSSWPQSCGLPAKIQPSSIGCPEPWGWNLKLILLEKFLPPPWTFFFKLVKLAQKLHYSRYAWEKEKVRENAMREENKCAWGIIVLKLLLIYLKSSSNLVSCVLSGNLSCQ